MAYRLRYQVSVDFVPPGMGLGLNNPFGPGEVGGPAQTLTFFGSQGSATPTSTTFTATDVTNMLTSLTTDISAQMSTAANLARVTAFGSGGWVMALKTLGTNASTSLQAFIVGFNDVIPADVASLNTALRFDPPGFAGEDFPPVSRTTGLITQTGAGGIGTVRNRVNQAYMQTGVLVIPNRGMLQLVSGDIVCWDTTTGWPIVISGDAAANGPYTHT